MCVPNRGEAGGGDSPPLDRPDFSTAVSLKGVGVADFPPLEGMARHHEEGGGGQVTTLCLTRGEGVDSGGREPENPYGFQLLSSHEVGVINRASIRGTNSLNRWWPLIADQCLV